VIAGRKLLLADDSIAIQRVVDLTFTDEGMEVTTVSDGQDALEKLEQSTPDVVLADIFMPGVDGYELCKFIKQSERLRGVPVMLLVGSFEPFDKSEAERAGADDVVTKPFQSIRDLVNRVGLLVRRDDASKHAVGEVPENEDFAMTPEQPQVTVLVEAPMMETSEVEDLAEHTCPPPIDLQTADTQQLKPVHVKPEFEESVEVEVVDEADHFESPADTWNATRFAGSSHDDSHASMVRDLDDGVLDLGDVDTFAAAPVGDDFELEVDVEPVVTNEVNLSSSEAPAVESPFATPEVSSARPAEEHIQQVMSDATPSHLSPEAIEAISQRVVEKLSDQVVREIAWEVVPELSELLIKRQLDERR
jgi:CheY-like chemotaxis protein